MMYSGANIPLLFITYIHVLVSPQRITQWRVYCPQIEMHVHMYGNSTCSSVTPSIKINSKGKKIPDSSLLLTQPLKKG